MMPPGVTINKWSRHSIQNTQLTFYKLRALCS